MRRHTSTWLGSACLLAAQASPAAAQTTTRVSVDSLAIQGNDDSESVAISTDGRYVAFWSAASNLVSGDTNGTRDIFVRDRVTGTTERVSVDSLGVEGNGGCFEPAISADGRFVAFRSLASNMVSGDTNGSYDVFLRDRQSGTTECISVDSLGTEGDGHSLWPSMSADGRYVAFQSFANNLVGGDTNGQYDVFVRDRANGTTERVSIDSFGAQADSGSWVPSISADGRFVAFQSYATNLVAGDTNGKPDIFVRDRLTGTTERVSIDSLGLEANDNSIRLSISADGQFVAFWSYASNLVSGDTNGFADVFVRDRVAGTTERVSVDSAGAEGNGDSLDPSISSDGRYVAFYSIATNLVAGDVNGKHDVFLRDRLNGTTERVSISSLGAQANGGSYYPVVSANGSCIAYYSNATNLVSADTNARYDVFVRSLSEPGTRFCSPGEAGVLACPCAPGTDAPHDPGHGCSNSLDSAGGLLVGSGAAIAGARSDTLVLTATDITNGLVIFIEGPSAGPGLPFGDGVRCVSGALKRFGLQVASLRTALYPRQAGDPPISVATGALSGQTKCYQAFHRDPAPWCNAATFNITSAYAIAWQ